MARALIFGPFRLDLAGNQLWRSEERIDLTPRAFDVLAYLAGHAGEIVTRERLFSALWPDVFVADHALSVQIAELRKALGDNPQEPAYIETRHRRGYRFCAPVETVETQVASAAAATMVRSAAAEMPAAPALVGISSPKTLYLDNDGVNIAYQVLGDGPVDLVFVMGWVSHLEYFWTEPRFARFLRRLSSFSRVLLFDKRGTGLSDRVPLHQLPTIEQRVEDVHAVMDTIGSEKAILCGVSEGGCMATVYAAAYPQRATGLVLINSYARRIWAPDYPWAPTVEQRQVLLDDIRHNWGGPVGLKERAPSLANDPQFRDWWAAYLRMGASPGAALALTIMNTETDIRHVLPHVRVPTLVLHRSGDRCLKVEEGRFIASRIPGAELIEVPGEDHLPFVGDQETILQHIENFVSSLPDPVRSTSVLATVLAGEFQSSDEGLETTVRTELDRFGAREVEYSWPHVTAAFGGPVRALQSAGALRKTAVERRLGARFGLHTGELRSRPGAPVGGPAAVVAQRLLAQAGWNQALATGTLRDLVAGSGIRFSALGRVDAPGIGEWQLLEVEQ